MTNPTSNFGWLMPTATDLVTDLPADFEVFGQAVDTDFAGLLGGTTGQVLSKASDTDLDFVWSADAAGMANPMTTTGDIIYSSPGSTPVRLGVGATDEVLTVAGGVPTWAAAASPGSSFTELSTGTISGTSYSVTGLSGYNKIAISFQNCRNSTNYMSVRFNNDTGANYSFYGVALKSTGATTGDASEDDSVNGDQFYLAYNSTSTSNLSGFMFLDGCNTTGLKIGNQIIGIASTDTNSSYTAGLAYKGTSVISSMEFFSPNGGTNSNGTIKVYGSVV